jgi:hypothetical protein
VLEKYQPKTGTALALSASGTTAVLSSNDSRWGQPDDLQLVERATGKVLGKAHGFLVGAPGDGEAYAYTDHWLIALTNNDNRADLELPALDPKAQWILDWSTVDYASGTALLVFREDFMLERLERPDEDRDRTDSRYELVEIDLATMKSRGHATLSLLGSTMTADDVAKTIANAETEGGTKQRVYGSAARACDFASVASGASVFLTCRVPEANDGKVEHWVVSRWNGHAIAWSTPLELPPALGGGDVMSSLSGDGKTLVLAHGDLSYGVLEGDTTILIDAASGRARTVNRGPHKMDDLGDIAQIIPLPGAAAVVQVHVFEPPAHSGADRSFHGFSRVDATTGAITTLLDTSTARRDMRRYVPGPVVILPSGTYLLGY